MDKRSMIKKVAASFFCIGLLLANIPIYAFAADQQKDVPNYKEGEVIVKFKNGRNAMNLGNTRSKHNLKEKKNLDRSTTKLVTYDAKTSSIDEVIKDLEASGQVEYAQPNYIRKSNAVTDPGYSLQWGLKNIGQEVNETIGTPGYDMGVEEAWSITRGSANMVVAVIDTGIDINHPDLKNNIWRNPGEIAGDGIDNDKNGFIDDVNGWDFAHRDNTVFDLYAEDDHGTHVAGTIAADNNNIGVVGVAPNVKIMPLKFLTSNGGTVADEIAAINYAKSIGVKVINISSGGSGFSEAEYDAIANSNALVVAAAGNGEKNNDGDDPDYPASYDLDNIISVGAMDSNGDMPYWSNYGMESVDIVAPGVDILSTLPGKNGNYASAYGYSDGTSMATPHVTGTVALMLSNHPTYSFSALKEDLLLFNKINIDYIGKVASEGYVHAGKAITRDLLEPNPPVARKNFTDIQSVPWAKDAIEIMAGLGIINGVGNNKYDPGSNVTRAQFAKLIVNTLGITETASNPFKDVKPSDWFAKDVALAYKHGIITGVSSTQFAPNRPITRQEMAVMMVRAMKLKQQVTANNMNGTLGKFTDRNQIDSWASKGVAIAIEQELMYGMTQTIFSPKTNANRAQSAVIMYRFYEKFIK